MERRQKAWMWVMCAALGCSESGPQADAAVTTDTVSTDAVTTDTVSTDAVTTDTVSTDAVATDTVSDDAAPGLGRLVINEIRATGEEWVELYNAGTGALDLSNVRVADSESDGGARLSRAMTFPAGVMLAPREYLVLATGLSDAGVGLQTACVDGGPSTCYHAGWGLSATRGEAVHVLSPTGTVIAEETYPPDAVPAGQTYGRLPNGEGPFAPNRPTPGTVNAAP